MTKSMLIYSLASYFILGMHYVGSTVGGSGLYLPNNIVGWCFISIFIGIGFWQISNTGIIYYSKFLLICFFSFFLFILPMYYPNGLFAERTIYRLIFIAGGILLYATVIQFDVNDKDRYRILYYILFAVIIQSIIGIIKHYGIGPQQYLIFAKESHPWGSFRQKNVMSTFMATGIGLSLFLINKSDNNYTKLQYWALQIMPASGSLIIAAIASKAGYLGLIATTFFQIPSTNLKNKKIQIWLLMLFIGITIGLSTPRIAKLLSDFGLLENQTKTSFVDRDMNSQIATINTRIGIWGTTWEMIKENPISGVGYGYWERKWREKASKKRRDEPKWNYRLTELLDHPHNEILLYVSEGGMAPAFAFLSLFIGYFYLMYRQTIKFKLNHIALTAPILLQTIYEFPFRVSVAHWIVILIIIAIYDKSLPGYKIKLKSVFLIPAVIIPIITIYNMAITYKNSQILVQFADSDDKNYEVLNKIIHPGPLYRKYEFDLLRSMLDLALKANSRDLMQKFIDRAEEFLEHTPHISVYHGLHDANIFMKRGRVAESWKFKARRMFPDPYEDTTWLYNEEDIKIKKQKEKELSEKLKIAEDFLLKNKIENKDIIETKSGLQYRIIKAGKGASPKRNDHVKVNYAGPYFTLDDFEAASKKGNIVEFEINKLIPGWQEGIPLMKEGGEFEFFIHPKLGYGRQGRRGVPQNAYLIFNVKLIEILK